MKPFLTASLILGLFAAATLAAADTALIVSVDRYDHLQDNDLEGCNNDNDAVARYYKSRGYKVKQVKDARMADLKAGFAWARQQTSSGETFAFFMSSHGGHSTDGSFSLILRDTDPYNGKNLLAGGDLRSLVRSVGGARSLVTLDACFAGEAIPKSWRSRLKGVLVKGIELPFAIPPSRRAMNPFRDVDREIVYRTAAANTPCIEMMIDGVVRGVFAKRFYDRLALARAGETNADVLEDVTRAVATMSDQRPQISSWAKSIPPYDGPSATSANNLGQLLASSFGGNRLQVRSNVAPNATISFGSGVAFEATAKSDGYLVVINETGTAGGEGKTQLFVPGRPVKAGETVRLPREKVYTADTAGRETVRFYLFASAEAAREVVSLFQNRVLRRSDAERLRLSIPADDVEKDEIRFTVAEAGR